MYEIYNNPKYYKIGDRVTLRPDLRINLTDDPFRSHIGESGIVIDKDSMYIWVKFDDGCLSGVSWPERWYKSSGRKPDWEV